MQLHFIIALMAAHCSWSISAEANQITPIAIVIHSDNCNLILVCPSEIMRDDAQQLLKNIISAKISSFVTTEPLTAGVTSSATTTTSTPITTTSMPPAVLLQSCLFGGVLGGDPFQIDDYNDNITGIVGMQIDTTYRASLGDAISSIQVTYPLKNGTNFHCFCAWFNKWPNTVLYFSRYSERLTRMDGMHSVGPTDRMISMLTFYSNRNNVYIWSLWGNWCFCNGMQKRLWHSMDALVVFWMALVYTTSIIDAYIVIP